jgi:hypothetical protein
VRIPDCRSCGLPVLGLHGQIANLDSYFISDGAPPPESAGWWHVACLAASPFAADWYQARLRNFRDVRGYESVAELAHWSVLRLQRTGDVTALGREGGLLSLSPRHGRPRPVPGGVIYRVVEDEYHLELADEAIVQTIHEALTSEGTYPLPALIEQLGIGNRMAHPEALERGLFRFNKSLRRDWMRRAVSSSIEYGVFVPTELVPYIAAK